jgi:hypothetical protein
MFASFRGPNTRFVLSGTKLTVLTVLGLAGAAAFAFGKPVVEERDATCFGSNIEHPYAAQIARNTVFIAKVLADGTLVSAATGFVVRGTAADRPRIVTAAHVVNSNAPDKLFMVFLSDGMPVGIPRVIAEPTRQNISIADDDLTINDLAVLDMAQFSGDIARARFTALEGLPARAGSALMVGETNGPTGVIWGYSGAPAVDRDGEIIGVATGADFRGRVTRNLGLIQDSDASGRPHNSDITLPNRSLVLVEPLHTPEILAALDLSETAPKAQSEGPVVLAGFPFASCASTSARLQPAESADGMQLIKKWQLLDQVGAWWLPSLGSRKLRLTPG